MIIYFFARYFKDGFTIALDFDKLPGQPHSSNFLYAKFDCRIKAFPGSVHKKYPVSVFKKNGSVCGFHALFISFLIAFIKYPLGLFARFALGFIFDMKNIKFSILFCASLNRSIFCFISIGVKSNPCFK